MADAADLKSAGPSVARAGSSPAPGTGFKFLEHPEEAPDWEGGEL